MTQITIPKEVSLTELESGYDFLQYEKPPQSFLSVNKDSGVITLTGIEKPLADSKSSLELVVVGAFTAWDYLPKGEAKPVRRDLVTQKNCMLKDWEEVTAIDYNGNQVDVRRMKSVSVLGIITDLESKGPVTLSLRGQKLKAAQSTLMSDFREKAQKKQWIYSTAWLISSEQVMNAKKQKFYVYTFKKGKEITEASKLEYFHAIHMDFKKSQDYLVSQLEDESGSAHE